MEAMVTEQSEINVNHAAGDLIDANGVPVSVVHVTIPNQNAISVQSVIQGQHSVIQTAGGQTIQAIQVVGDGDGNFNIAVEDEESRKRREHLARRPSYRKILNDLSGDTNNITVAKIEEESNSSQDSGDDGGTLVPIQIATGDGSAGLQTLTMTNVASSAASTANAPAVLQYAQGADGQFFIPVSTISPGNQITYQIAPASSALNQSVVMASTGSSVSSPTGVPEEASRKRELRLLKNREAARECRRKKKDYIKCLENRVALLENQNKTLIEELKSLKELYCQKDVQ